MWKIVQLTYSKPKFNRLESTFYWFVENWFLEKVPLGSQKSNARQMTIKFNAFLESLAAKTMFLEKRFSKNFNRSSMNSSIKAKISLKMVKNLLFEKM